MDLNNSNHSFGRDLSNRLQVSASLSDPIKINPSFDSPLNEKKEILDLNSFEMSPYWEKSKMLVAILQSWGMFDDKGHYSSDHFFSSKRRSHEVIRELAFSFSSLKPLKDQLWEPRHVLARARTHTPFIVGRVLQKLLQTISAGSITISKEWDSLPSDGEIRAVQELAWVSFQEIIEEFSKDILYQEDEKFHYAVDELFKLSFNFSPPVSENISYEIYTSNSSEWDSLISQVKQEFQNCFKSLQVDDHVLISENPGEYKEIKIAFLNESVCFKFISPQAPPKEIALSFLINAEVFNEEGKNQDTIQLKINHPHPEEVIFSKLCRKFSLVDPNDARCTLIDYLYTDNLWTEEGIEEKLLSQTIQLKRNTLPDSNACSQWLSRYANSPFFNDFNQFLEEKKILFNPKEKAHLFYLLNLIVEKTGWDHPRKKREDLFTLNFVFKFSQSLQQAGELTDPQISLIWQYLHSKKILGKYPSEEFMHSIKQCIIKHQMPFSALSGWLALLSSPYATTYKGKIWLDGAINLPLTSNLHAALNDLERLFTKPSKTLTLQLLKMQNCFSALFEIEKCKNLQLSIEESSRLETFVKKLIHNPDPLICLLGINLAPIFSDERLLTCCWEQIPRLLSLSESKLFLKKHFQPFWNLQKRIYQKFGLEREGCFNADSVESWIDLLFDARKQAKKNSVEKKSLLEVINSLLPLNDSIKANHSKSNKRVSFDETPTIVTYSKPSLNIIPHSKVPLTSPPYTSSWDALYTYLQSKNLLEGIPNFLTLKDKNLLLRKAQKKFNEQINYLLGEKQELRLGNVSALYTINNLLSGLPYEEFKFLDDSLLWIFGEELVRAILSVYQVPKELIKDDLFEACHQFPASIEFVFPPLIQKSDKIVTLAGPVMEFLAKIFNKDIKDVASLCQSKLTPLKNSTNRCVNIFLENWKKEDQTCTFDLSLTFIKSLNSQPVVYEDGIEVSKQKSPDHGYSVSNVEKKLFSVFIPVIFHSLVRRLGLNKGAQIDEKMIHYHQENIPLQKVLQSDEASKVSIQSGPLSHYRENFLSQIELIQKDKYPLKKLKELLSQLWDKFDSTPQILLTFMLDDRIKGLQNAFPLMMLEKYLVLLKRDLNFSMGEKRNLIISLSKLVALTNRPIEQKEALKHLLRLLNEIICSPFRLSYEKKESLTLSLDGLIKVLYQENDKEFLWNLLKTLSLLNLKLPFLRSHSCAFADKMLTTLNLDQMDLDLALTIYSFLQLHADLEDKKKLEEKIKPELALKCVQYEAYQEKAVEFAKDLGTQDKDVVRNVLSKLKSDKNLKLIQTTLNFSKDTFLDDKELWSEWEDLLHTYSEELSLDEKVDIYIAQKDLALSFSSKNDLSPKLSKLMKQLLNPTTAGPKVTERYCEMSLTLLDTFDVFSLELKTSLLSNSISAIGMVTSPNDTKKLWERCKRDLSLKITTRAHLAVLSCCLIKKLPDPELLPYLDDEKFKSSIYFDKIGKLPEKAANLIFTNAIECLKIVPPLPIKLTSFVPFIDKYETVSKDSNKLVQTWLESRGSEETELAFELLEKSKNQNGDSSLTPTATLMKGIYLAISQNQGISLYHSFLEILQMKGWHIKNEEWEEFENNRAGALGKVLTHLLQEAREKKNFNLIGKFLHIFKQHKNLMFRKKPNLPNLHEQIIKSLLILLSSEKGRSIFKEITLDLFPASFSQTKLKRINQNSAFKTEVNLRLELIHAILEIDPSEASDEALELSLKTIEDQFIYLIETPDCDLNELINLLKKYIASSPFSSKEFKHIISQKHFDSIISLFQKMNRPDLLERFSSFTRFLSIFIDCTNKGIKTFKEALPGDFLEVLYLLIESNNYGSLLRATSLFEHEIDYFRKNPQAFKKLLFLFKTCEASNWDLLTLQASFLKENIYPFLCDNRSDKFPEDDIKKEWVLLLPTLSLDYQEAQNRMDVLTKRLSSNNQDKILMDEAPSKLKSGFKAGDLENKQVSNKLKESEQEKKLEISSPSLQEQTSVDAFRQLISKKPIRDVSLVMSTFEKIKKEGKATSDLYQTYINILQRHSKFKEALEAFEEAKKLEPVI